MMVATLKKCTGAIEGLCQIKYDVFVLSICQRTKEICTADKIRKLLLRGPLIFIDF